MDKSGIFVGGAIGAAITIVIVAVLFVAPPESVKPEIIVSNGYGPSTVGETTPLYSEKLSLIEIFEKSDVDAALAASIFHYENQSVSQVKEILQDKNISVRL